MVNRVKRHDLTGRRFTRLVVVSRSHVDPKAGDVWWNCLCDCGTEKKIRAYTLLRGTTRSCGCLQREVARAQAFSNDPASVRHRAAHKRWYDKHKEEYREKRRAQYQANKGWLYVRNRRLAVQEAEALRPKPTHCEACGNDKARIEFDHCHQRGGFRGWLCTHCNVILGHAKDDPNRLRKLIAYLQRTKDLARPQMVLSGI